MKKKPHISSIRTDIANMPEIKKPEIIVFAGPNGSGKSTITQFAKVIEPYINADEIKKANNCSEFSKNENQNISFGKMSSGLKKKFRNL